MGKKYNDARLIQIKNNLKNLYMTSLKIEGLPQTINKRYMMFELLHSGRIVVFKDEVLNEFYGLRGAVGTDLDVYGEGRQVTIHGANGYYKKRRNHVNCVVLYENYTRVPPISRLMDYAEQLYEIENTMQLNIKAQKTPYIIKTTKNLLTTIQNVFRRIANYDDVVIVDKKFDTYASIEVLKLDAPIVVDKLRAEKQALKNEILSFCGIENQGTEKRERVNVQESLLANGESVSNLNARMISLQDGVDELKTMFVDAFKDVEIVPQTFKNLTNNTPLDIIEEFVLKKEGEQDDNGISE